MASYEGTIPISGPISPRDTRDEYPTHSDQFTKGGYRTVLTITDRDAIPSDRRKNGMLVYVVEDDKTFILKSNVWEEVSVQITVQSLDDSVVFDDVENIKIDTNSGLGLNRNSNEPGTVILTSQKPFSEFTDSNGDNISANNTETVKFKETSTILPKVEGNSVIFNTRTFNYKSTTPSVQHLIVHNLGTNILIANIYVVNDNGSMDFTVIPYTISDLNTIELTLSVAKNVMVNIIPLEPI
jgi:hypothetical protein